MIIEESGRVIAVDGDQAWVVTERQSACGSCAANKGCGTGIMSRAFSSGRQIRIKVSNAVGAAVGDEVVLGIDDRMVLRSSILMYLLPLLALLFGAFLGKFIDETVRLFNADYLSAGVGIAAMLLVFIWLHRHPRLLVAEGDCQPRILRRGRAIV